MAQIDHLALDVVDPCRPCRLCLGLYLCLYLFLSRRLCLSHRLCLSRRLCLSPRHLYRFLWRTLVPLDPHSPLAISVECPCQKKRLWSLKFMTFMTRKDHWSLIDRKWYNTTTSTTITSHMNRSQCPRHLFGWHSRGAQRGNHTTLPAPQVTGNSTLFCFNFNSTSIWGQHQRVSRSLHNLYYPKSQSQLTLWRQSINEAIEFPALYFLRRRFAVAPSETRIVTTHWAFSHNVDLTTQIQFTLWNHWVMICLSGSVMGPVMCHPSEPLWRKELIDSTHDCGSCKTGHSHWRNCQFLLAFLFCDAAAAAQQHCYLSSLKRTGSKALVGLASMIWHKQLEQRWFDNLWQSEQALIRPLCTIVSLRKKKRSWTWLGLISVLTYLPFNFWTDCKWRPMIGLWQHKARKWLRNLPAKTSWPCQGGGGGLSCFQ